jgi:DNA-binding LacI/PurR family transcriptional regulator
MKRFMSLDFICFPLWLRGSGAFCVWLKTRSVSILLSFSTFYIKNKISKRSKKVICRIGVEFPPSGILMALGDEARWAYIHRILHGSINFGGTARKPDYRRIAEALRHDILSGKCPTGMQLPSTGDLAATWKSSPSTIHTALVSLVKEGWIQRLNGAGTYVADPGHRFTCAGIYHSADICNNKYPPFTRSLHMSLLDEFKRLGKETQIFIDTRPPEKQGKLLPTLEKAILERRVQCVVAPILNPYSLPALVSLKLPTAFLTNASPHQINFDIEDLLRESVRRLAAQGCRSVGVLSPIGPRRQGQIKAIFYSQFEKAAQAEGLLTRSEWMVKPAHYVADFESYGYAEFLQFWKLKKKPDGMLVYPDTLVRGVITAILELGIQVVPPRMKFIFHRNAHVDLLCPFPVTWAISDEKIWAEWLVRVIQKQFNGEKVAPVLLPFAFQESKPPKR